MATKFRRNPVIIEDSESIQLDHFYTPLHYQGSLECLLITHGTIVDRVEKLAYDICRDYESETVHLLCVLKGGSAFFQDLCVKLRMMHDYARKSYIPYSFDYIRVKSYHGTSSSGQVSISGCDVSKLVGKHVIFVEDIIDTGLTMTKLMDYMAAEVKPASVKVASLLEKRTDRSCGFQADYVGFSIPDRFVVGYSIDYNEYFRDLNHVAVVSEAGIQKYKSTEL